MTDVAYTSRVKVEPVEGKIRRAEIPAEDESILFGVHSEVAEHLRRFPRTRRSRTPRPWITWSPRRVVDCSGPLEARWERVKWISKTSRPTRSAR